jgi:cyclic dehypoxanthinyl futalosine synthase
MHIAHTMGFATSATMMYGHIENLRQRLVHLDRIRELQSQVPNGQPGFLAFIPWIFRSTGTCLEQEEGISTRFSSVEYLKLIAISRLMLNNVANIQASWLTVGAQTAQLSLWGGANDMGSIMIEENVVSSAGAHNQFDAEGMKRAITQAGFIPRLRDQKYILRD